MLVMSWYAFENPSSSSCMVLSSGTVLLASQLVTRASCQVPEMECLPDSPVPMACRGISSALCSSSGACAASIATATWPLSACPAFMLVSFSSVEPVPAACFGAGRACSCCCCCWPAPGALSACSGTHGFSCNQVCLEACQSSVSS